MFHVNRKESSCTAFIYNYNYHPPTPADSRGGRQRRGAKRRSKSIESTEKSKRQEAGASKTWKEARRKKKASGEASVLETSGLLAWCFGVARLQFGASFLSVQKVALGKGSRRPKARSVLQGASVWRRQRFGSLNQWHDVSVVQKATLGRGSRRPKARSCQIALSAYLCCCSGPSASLQCQPCSNLCCQHKLLSLTATNAPNPKGTASVRSSTIICIYIYI